VLTVLADIAHPGRLLVATFVVAVSVLLSLRRAGDRPRRFPVLAKIALAVVCWLALAYAGFSLVVATFVLAVGGILVSLIRASGNPRRLPVLTAIGLVLLCWAAVAYAGFNLAACGLGEYESAQVRVCYSTTAATAYAAAVIAAAAIALITVVTGHVLGRRRVALTGGLFSLALVVAAVIWGLKTGVRAR